MAKAAASSSEPVAPSFEAALAELEMIVKAMEAGPSSAAKQLSLEESLAAYQRGMLLLQFCQESLAAAEQKIRILEKDSLRDFTPTADE